MGDEVPVTYSRLSADFFGGPCISMVSKDESKLKQSRLLYLSSGLLSSTAPSKLPHVFVIWKNWSQWHGSLS